MPLTVGVLKETLEGETRVALTPEISTKLKKLGVSVVMEHDAGAGSQLLDSAYEGVEFTDADGVLGRCGLLLTVQPPAADTVRKLGEGSVTAGFVYGHLHADLVGALKEKRHTAFAMELVPRISRAQSMDVLSSQAAAAGYQAALIAASTLDKFFPMLTTTLVGLRNLDARVIEHAVLDGANWWRGLIQVELPIAAPAIMAGVRAGVVLSMTGAIVGEFVMGGSGLGTLLTISRQSTDTVGMFAVLVWIAITALVLQGTVQVLERGTRNRLQGESS